MFECKCKATLVVVNSGCAGRCHRAQGAQNYRIPVHHSSQQSTRFSGHVECMPPATQWIVRLQQRVELKGVVAASYWQLGAGCWLLVAGQGFPAAAIVHSLKLPSARLRCRNITVLDNRLHCFIRAQVVSVYWSNGAEQVRGPSLRRLWRVKLGSQLR